MQLGTEVHCNFRVDWEVPEKLRPGARIKCLNVALLEDCLEGVMSESLATAIRNVPSMLFIGSNVAISPTLEKYEGQIGHLLDEENHRNQFRGNSQLVSVIDGFAALNIMTWMPPTLFMFFQQHACRLCSSFEECVKDGSNPQLRGYDKFDEKKYFLTDFRPFMFSTLMGPDVDCWQGLFSYLL